MKSEIVIEKLRSNATKHELKQRRVMLRRLEKNGILYKEVDKSFSSIIDFKSMLDLAKKITDNMEPHQLQRILNMCDKLAKK
jgi:hypothetical protein